MAWPEYAELQARSNFSFLRGASHPDELVKEAHRLKLRGLALCDRNGVYGIPKGYWAAKDLEGFGEQFRFIVGTEVMISDPATRATATPLTLLVRDRAAYGVLCRLLTAAHAGKEKGQASLRSDELMAHLARAEARGMLALSADATLLPMLKDALTADRLWIPLSRFRDGHDSHRTETARAAAKRYGLKLVATNDVHMHVRERHKLQTALTCVREGQALQDIGFGIHSNAERYLKSADEMARLFADLPNAITETVAIAESCRFSPAELRYRYPSEWIPQGHTAQTYLDDLTWQGARARYGAVIPQAVVRQLEHELTLIEKLQFADYFLTIHDIVNFAKERKILCQGRGSAANSAVCYVLGITAVDPVKMNLLFERFLSVERNEPPDIDVDFEHERREEVIQYIYSKYGRDRAAMVSAVITYQGRSAFREMAKVVGVDVGVRGAKDVEKEFEKLSKTSGLPHVKALVDQFADDVHGFPRHLSIHSGGFTLSADPIIEIVPVEPARMPGRTIIQWDKYDLDYLGLLKVDVLSLGMLAALQKTLAATKTRNGPGELYAIPADDPATYEMIGRADTVGTFQIESRAQMSMLGRLQPKNFYDLVIEVAIVRPGPIVGKMVHPYLRRRRGQEAVSFPHPKLKNILQKTLGVPLFQEQVMKMAIELAGFTPGEADDLRRAIGAWRSNGNIQKMGQRLKNGLVEAGLSEAFASQILEQIKGFAHYGFPESHAASFALIAYASAYLKCHYPAEFVCALVNSQPMGFYSNHTLIDDAKRHGVKILPVDPNRSDWDCRLVPAENPAAPPAVRLGLRVVHGLSRAEADRLVAKRPYQSLQDLVWRAPVRRDVLVRMAMGGVLNGLSRASHERNLLWEVLALQTGHDRPQGELCFDGAASPDAGPEAGPAPEFAPLTLYDAIREDYSAFHLSTRGHPVEAIRKAFDIPRLTCKDIKKRNTGSQIKALGLLIIRQKPPTAKGVCFATLEDEDGFLDLILWPDVYQRVKEIFLYHSIFWVSGRLQRDGNSTSVLVTDIQDIGADRVATSKASGCGYHA